MRHSSKDEDIEEFKKILRSNTFKHKEYNPNLDTVFGKFLFEGIMSERIENDETISTVKDFILKE